MLTTGENARIPLARATCVWRGHSKATGLSTPLGISNTMAGAAAIVHPYKTARPDP